MIYVDKNLRCEGDIICGIYLYVGGDIIVKNGGIFC
jgi:hypothetical protein